jgi:hypothetical protein
MELDPESEPEPVSEPGAGAEAEGNTRDWNCSWN